VALGTSRDGASTATPGNGRVKVIEICQF